MCFFFANTDHTRTGRDWSSGDRPDNYASREAQFENIGRPAEHQWRGSANLWQAPKQGSDAIERDLTLEQKLFATGQGVQGINFEKYSDIPIEVTGSDKPAPVQRFEEMAIGSALQFNIQLAKYQSPTPVQKAAIPIVLANRDLMACAQTGSGKTAAFLLPTLAGLLKDPKILEASQKPQHALDRPKVLPKILVLAPTRELACQIYDDACKFAYRTAVRPVVVYGGAEISYQIQQVL